MRQTFAKIRMTEKPGLSLRGVAFMTGFGGSGEHLALLLLVLHNTVPRGDFQGSDTFFSFGCCGGFGCDVYPT